VKLQLLWVQEMFSCKHVEQQLLPVPRTLLLVLPACSLFFAGPADVLAAFEDKAAAKAVNLQAGVLIKTIV
jgi:hypothetical protein